MLGITTMWTYRLSGAPTEKFGYSLQAYDKKRQRWVHMAFFEEHKIEQAKVTYEKAMKYTDIMPHYLKFSFNNLIEIQKMMGECEKNFGDERVDIQNMMVNVCHILEIKVEEL